MLKVYSLSLQNLKALAVVVMRFGLLADAKKNL